MSKDAFGKDDLSAWCSQWLESRPVRSLFRSGFLSTVLGLQLEDGREVVIKIRSPQERLDACHRIHRSVWESGFPCPEPIAGPAPLGELVATAEAWVPGGEPLQRDEKASALSASAMARLMGVIPRRSDTVRLGAPPPWVWWDHPAEQIWPWPDDRDDNLNESPGPEWLERVGLAVRNRLTGSELDVVVGHCDWWSGNVRWSGEKLHVVHDWDSLAARPEAAIVGAAAANFPATTPGTEATVKETEMFLDAYQEARDRSFTHEENEIAWAAGIWVRAFDSKKESLDEPEGPIQSLLRSEVTERSKRAGL